VADTGAPFISTIDERAYSMFQLFFAIITPAILSGAVVGKIKYQWFMAFVALWHLFVYCPLAHWLFFYDGWLFVYGAIDFAGGMVVHTSSGVSALVLTWWLGNPKHRAPVSPHSVPYVLLGGGLLWFGWFGFNAGSALAANALAARAFVNTQHGAAMAMMTWGAMEVIFNGDKWFSGRPTAVGAAMGAVIGLVGVTPACGYVSSMWALFIGFFTVVVCFFAPRFVRFIGIDDRLDAFACHGVGGMVGSLLTGLFASKELGASAVDGGFFGDGGVLFGKQIVAILVTVAMSAVFTSLIYWFLVLVARVLFKTDIRIPDEASHEVDASQHGEKAYFRTVKSVAAAPAAAGALEGKAATLEDVAPSTVKTTVVPAAEAV
jgi:ammonium transporter, Amt family